MLFPIIDGTTDERSSIIKVKTGFGIGKWVFYLKYSITYPSRHLLILNEKGFNMVYLFTGTTMNLILNSYLFRRTVVGTVRHKSNMSR